MKSSRLLLVLFLCLPLAYVQGAQFDALVLPTLTDPDMDAWYRIPQNSGPVILRAEQVVQGQAFVLPVFFKGYSAGKDNAVHITYDVEVYDPRKRLTEDKGYGLTAYQGPMGDQDLLILGQQLLKIIFTEEYPAGTYTIKVKAYDKAAQVTATSEAVIELVEFDLPAPFKSRGEAAEWMMGYYQNPTPLRAIDGLHQTVELDPKWLNKNVNVVAFFSRVFRDNPFLLKNVAARFDKFSPEDKKRFLLIAAVSGDPGLDAVAAKLEGEMREFNERIRKIALPSLDGEINTATQLDMLWAEFLATGRYEPVRKVVSALALEKYQGTLDKIKSGELDKSKPEVRREAYLDATYQSAVWSLASNCKQMPLVLKYCAFMYENEDLDPNIKSQLGAILAKVKHDQDKAQGSERGS